MNEKNWFQQDFVYFRFTQGRFLLTVAWIILILVVYSILCYGIGRGVAKQWFRKLWWWAFWWIYYKMK